MTTANPSVQSSHTLAKLLAQSEFDDLIKHAQEIPIESEEHIDDLGEILFEPVPVDGQLPFDNVH